MKIGDLVRVKACQEVGWTDFACECFFCSSNSNRVGLVTGPAPRDSWRVMLTAVSGGLTTLKKLEER